MRTLQNAAARRQQARDGHGYNVLGRGRALAAARAARPVGAAIHEIPKRSHGCFLQRPETLAPDVWKKPGLYRRGASGVGARDWDEHCDFFGRECGLVEAGAIPRTGSSRHVHEHVATRLGHGRVSREIRALAATDERGPGRFSLPEWSGQLHGWGVPGADPIQPG